MATVVLDESPERSSKADAIELFDVPVEPTQLSDVNNSGSAETQINVVAL